MLRDHVNVVFQLFAMSRCQAHKAFLVLAYRLVMLFDVRSGNQRFDGLSKRPMLANAASARLARQKAAQLQKLADRLS
ncbi:MAG TPA: hypothetical protein VK641_03145 [Terriglobales bacterium]|jgi:hypothetical protein|nr:hypothetical protein [Terriglobales bacterium]